MKMKFKRFKFSLGLSLTETLIIVAILALLVTLAATAYVKQIAKGNDSRRKADLNRIKIAVEEYEKDNNCYPSPLDMAKCGSSEDIAIYPYLRDVPCDPATKEPYVYEAIGTSCPRSFKVYTTLQNTNDAQIIANVGPGGAYNFYISSEGSPGAIPPPTSGTYPTGNPGYGTYHYGCIDGVCQQIPLNNQGNPICMNRTFDTPNCNGNDCSDPDYACY